MSHCSCLVHRLVQERRTGETEWLLLNRQGFSNVHFSKVWRVQKCIPLVGAKTALTCAGLQTTPSHVSLYKSENGNLRTSGSTFWHGTAFVPKQCLYQKEATGTDLQSIIYAYLLKGCSLVPSPPLFAFTIHASDKWRMKSGGQKVDIAGEGPNCQNNTLDHPFNHSIAVLDSRR